MKRNQGTVFAAFILPSMLVAVIAAAPLALRAEETALSKQDTMAAEQQPSAAPVSQQPTAPETPAEQAAPASQQPAEDHAPAASPEQAAPAPEKSAEAPVPAASTDQGTTAIPAPAESAPIPEAQPAHAPAKKESGPAPAEATEAAKNGAPETGDRSGGGLIAPGETLTVSKCIEIALTKNPGIMASTGTVEIYRSRVGEARSAYYPQINAVGSYSRSRVNADTSSIVLGGASNTIPARSPAVEAITPSHLASASLLLNQNIFDFGRTSSSVNVSKFNLASSQSDLNTSQDAIILSVKQAYYGMLQAQRSRDVATDVIKQFQLHLDQAKGFYDVGTKAKIDVIKAEVDLSNAKLLLINAENALKLARVTLNNVMGVPDPPDYAIEDNLSFQQYPITLEDATAKAFENRPDLKSIVAKRRAAESNVSLQRSDYYPALSGSAGYTKSAYELDQPPDTNTKTNSWNAGVTLTVPLFEGLVTRYRVAEAKSSLAVSKANEEALRQQILFDVRQAYLNLHAAEASIATAELAARQAKENLDLANGRYAAGVGNPIEVSDAFATYVAAQASYTNALYNYKIAQASIEKAMGER